VPDTENHEGGYGYIHDFKQGVPADGLYEIRVKAQAMHREHPYDPAIFQRDTAQPFRLGIVPGDVQAGPLHHPQPIEPQLVEVTLKDGEAEWHTLKVPLLAGQTPRFIFPNGMANSRRAFGTLARKYQDQWPEKERKDLGIFQARRVVLQYGKMPHIRIHEIEIRGPIVQEWPPASSPGPRRGGGPAHECGGYAQTGGQHAFRGDEGRSQSRALLAGVSLSGGPCGEGGEAQRPCLCHTPLLLSLVHHAGCGAARLGRQRRAFAGGGQARANAPPARQRACGGLRRGLSRCLAQSSP